METVKLFKIEEEGNAYEDLVFANSEKEAKEYVRNRYLMTDTILCVHLLWDTGLYQKIKPQFVCGVSLESFRLDFNYG